MPNTPSKQSTGQSDSQALIEPTEWLYRPITIKGQSLPNRLFLAPMAGIGHVAFRELMADFGGYGLLFTGMCSAKALPTENPKFSTVFTWREEELPYLVCQIFGSEPATMAQAAKRVAKEGFFGIDINLGCCAAAICKQGCGAALLKKPDQARAIVSAVREAVDIPLFIKFRTGWDNDPEKAAQLSMAFENAGADALVFHPRVAPDRRARPPKWRHIRYVKEAVSIPVFGNGNLFDAEDCKTMLEQSGCDGVSIGRMAVARPWIFAELAYNLTQQGSSQSAGHACSTPHGPSQPGSGWPHFIQRKTPEMKKSPNIYHYGASRLLHLLQTHHDTPTAVRMFKKIIPYIAANFKFGHSICKELLKGKSPDAITQQIDQAFNSLPETVKRPNLHLFS